MSYIQHVAIGTNLPVAGAWYTGATAQPVRRHWAISQDQTFITLLVTYDAGGLGGRVKLRIEWTSIAETTGGLAKTWFETVTDNTIVVSGNTATASVYLLEYDIIATTNGAPITVPVDVRVPRDAAMFRVEGAEAGAVGTPGTFGIDIDGRV